MVPVPRDGAPAPQAGPQPESVPGPPAAPAPAARAIAPSLAELLRLTEQERERLETSDLQATLRRTPLVGADLRGLDLSSLDLSGLDLRRARLTGARLHDVDLRGALLSRADLEGADLLEASLDGAVLDHANLRDANLTRTSLRDAVLARSDLRRVRLYGADLAGADFERVDLRGGFLGGVSGYEKAHWKNVDIRDIDLHGTYLARRHIADQNYIHEFRSRGPAAELLYQIWWLTSDCGRSALRWGLLTVALSLVFAQAYVLVEVDYGPNETWLSPIYFSVVTMTTLGYGDAAPISATAQVLAMMQVTLGYVMLGGLLSIFSTKMARRAD